MADVKERLRRLETSLQEADGFVSERVDICRAAVREIEQLEVAADAFARATEQIRRLEHSVDRHAQVLEHITRLAQMEKPA
jgi:hypothetical protein